MLNLFNSLSRKKEEFIPLDKNHVRMYVCGPTVYDRPHIGNARSIVVYDMWFRLLREIFPKITYVRNITDVDDKINQRAKENNEKIEDLTKRITKDFHEDIEKLNVLEPTIEPKATEHISEILDMIKRLIKNGFAYEKQNHVLFDVEKLKSEQDFIYGELSGRKIEDLIAGARIEVEPYKKNPADFVLWKPSNEDEPGWESEYGYGRPGWHIECSAMSTKYLGEDFDIHGGGADLKFPHHENEIAQSRCSSVAKSNYAKYWIHNGFLMVEGEKMSKSLGNFILLHDLLNKNYDGEVIRYIFLQTHYRKPLNWTSNSLEKAKEKLDYFYRTLQILDGKKIKGKIDKRIISSLSDDLNTPKAYAVLNELAKQANQTGDKNIAADFLESGKFLGFFTNIPKKWLEEEGQQISEQVQKLINERNFARQNKDWKKADAIRDKLNKMGISTEDKKA